MTPKERNNDKQIDMSVLKSISKNFLIIIISIALAWLTSYQFGALYESFMGSTGSWIKLTGIVGAPFSYIFFLVLIFTGFGGAKKNWWIAGGLAPVILLLLVGESFKNYYFPAMIGIAGWLLGWGIGRLFSKKV